MLLIELRSNPDLNVKTSPLEQLKRIASSSDNPQNLFVTFTLHNKFGTNPQSSHATPIGLYAYPLQYVIDKKMDVPYAGNCPNIWVFEADNCWVLSGSVDTNVQASVEKALTDLGFEPDMLVEFPRTNNELYKGIVLTLRTAGYTKEKTNPNLMMRKVLTKAGIQGIVDPGTGTIHKNEPTQMVHFNVPSLHIKEHIRNKINVKSQIPNNDTSETMNFSDYCDKIVLGSYSRDVNIEKNINFDRAPTEYELRKFILKTVQQRAGRLQFLEKYIAQNPAASLAYARDVLQSRFPRGERVLRQDKDMWRSYVSLFPQLKYSSR